MTGTGHLREENFIIFWFLESGIKHDGGGGDDSSDNVDDEDSSVDKDDVVDMDDREVDSNKKKSRGEISL